MFLKISRFLTSTAMPMLAFPFIFWLQNKLGYEFAIFPLYLFPIAKLTWEFGWKGSLLTICISTVLWIFSSHLTDQPYTYEWLRYFNAAIRGSVFTAVGIFILMFKQVVEQHRQRMEAMRSLLNVCHGCGSVQGSNGKWYSLSELKVSKFKHTCECPSCTTLNDSSKAT
jgi:hypothetical protein